MGVLALMQQEHRGYWSGALNKPAAMSRHIRILWHGKIGNKQKHFSETHFPYTPDHESRRLSFRAENHQFVPSIRTSRNPVSALVGLKSTLVSVTEGTFPGHKFQVSPIPPCPTALAGCLGLLLISAARCFLWQDLGTENGRHWWQGSPPKVQRPQGSRHRGALSSVFLGQMVRRETRWSVFIKTQRKPTLPAADQLKALLSVRNHIISATSSTLELEQMGLIWIKQPKCPQRTDKQSFFFLFLGTYDHGHFSWLFMSSNLNLCLARLWKNLSHIVGVADMDTDLSGSILHKLLCCQVGFAAICIFFFFFMSIRLKLELTRCMTTGSGMYHCHPSSLIRLLQNKKCEIVEKVWYHPAVTLYELTSSPTLQLGFKEAFNSLWGDNKSHRGWYG